MAPEVVLTVTSSGVDEVMVTAPVMMEDPDEAAAFARSLSAALPDATTASALFGFAVISTPAVESEIIVVAANQNLGGSSVTDGAGAGIYIVVTAFAIASVGLAAIYCNKRKQQNSMPVTRVAGGGGRRTCSSMPFEMSSTAAPHVVSHAVDLDGDELGALKAHDRL